MLIQIEFRFCVWQAKATKTKIWVAAAEKCAKTTLYIVRRISLVVVLKYGNMDLGSGLGPNVDMIFVRFTAWFCSFCPSAVSVTFMWISSVFPFFFIARMADCTLGTQMPFKPISFAAWSLATVCWISMYEWMLGCTKVRRGSFFLVWQCRIVLPRKGVSVPHWKQRGFNFKTFFCVCVCFFKCIYVCSFVIQKKNNRIYFKYVIWHTLFNLHYFHPFRVDKQ